MSADRRWDSQNSWEKRRKVKLQTPFAVPSPICTPLIEQLRDEKNSIATSETSSSTYSTSETSSFWTEQSEESSSETSSSVEENAALEKSSVGVTSSSSSERLPSEAIKILYPMEEDTIGFHCTCERSDVVFWSLLQKPFSSAYSVKHRSPCVLRSEWNSQAESDYTDYTTASSDDTLDDEEFKDIFPEHDGEITVNVCSRRSPSPPSQVSYNSKYHRKSPSNHSNE
uniref:Uncharacterized protein n=1 Tax=Trichuris muris TaxID=70415 RepID=A0A5S6QB87_TRIMR